MIRARMSLLHILMKMMTMIGDYANRLFDYHINDCANLCQYSIPIRDLCRLLNVVGPGMPIRGSIRLGRAYMLSQRATLQCLPRLWFRS